MKQKKEPGRHYDPIEPTHGGHNILRLGAKAGLSIHNLLSLLALLAVLVALGSRLLKGGKYSSGALAAFVAVLFALSALYTSLRRKNE